MIVCYDRCRRGARQEGRAGEVLLPFFFAVFGLRSLESSNEQHGREYRKARRIHPGRNGPKKLEQVLSAYLKAVFPSLTRTACPAAGPEDLRQEGNVIDKDTRLSVVMPGMSAKVFVYGTLMRGRSNHRLLRNMRFRGRAVVHGLGLYAVTPHYPGAVREPGSAVRGEIYEVDKPTLRALDRLEDNGQLYRREIFPAVLEETGEIVEAWVYLWLPPVRPETAVPWHAQPWRP